MKYPLEQFKADFEEWFKTKEDTVKTSFPKHVEFFKMFARLAYLEGGTKMLEFAESKMKSLQDKLDSK